MTTTTTLQNRPLPRSYLSEEDKVGLSQKAICLCESVEADEAGDEEASWRWLALAGVEERTKRALIKTCGAEFLRSKGFDIPLPRSYLSEEDKVGLSQDDIYICESMRADEAGDEEAAWRWLALAKMTERTKRALIKTCGAEFLRSKGFDV
jgi:hypothetical protein